MSKFKDASENIKRLAVMFKGLVDLSESMDSIDSLENHIAELEINKSKLIESNLNLQKANDELNNINKSLLELSSDLKFQYQEQQNSQSKLLEDKKQLIKADCESFKLEKQKEFEKFDADLQSKLASKVLNIKGLDVEIESKSKKLEEINAALEKIKGGI